MRERAGNDNDWLTRYDARQLRDGTNSLTAEFNASALWRDLPGGRRTGLLDTESFLRSMEKSAEKKLDNVLNQLAAAGKKGQGADWTVALNLTTYFEMDGEGVFYRLESLKKFAEKTKGTKLTIVVQSAYVYEPSKAGEAESSLLERFVIKDGKVTKVSEKDAESKGYGQDLKDLVTYMGKNHPSSRMALIMDSHGLGNEGMFGDSGKLSVDGFVNCVRDGLKGSGREKLDLVHFDSCYMAQNGVMARVASVSDHMVASAEAEEIDGISLIPLFEMLRTQPASDAAALGRKLVTEARIQDQEFLEHNSAPPILTISHVNLKKYQSFRKSLDSLGEMLAELLKDPAFKPAVEAAIENARKYGTGGSITTLSMKFKPDQYRVDLKDFLDNLNATIEDGRIKDDDGALKRAVQDVLKERSSMVESSYGHGRYRGHGGLSVFLPGKDFRDIERESHLKTGAGRLAAMSAAVNLSEIFKNKESLAKFAATAKEELAWMRPLKGAFCIDFGVSGVDNERDDVSKALENLLNAKTVPERRKTLAAFHQAALDLEKTKPFVDMRARELKLLQEQANTLFAAQQDDGGKTGWSKFRKVLCGR